MDQEVTGALVTATGKKTSTVHIPTIYLFNCGRWRCADSSLQSFKLLNEATANYQLEQLGRSPCMACNTVGYIQ